MATKKKEKMEEKTPGASHSTSPLHEAAGKKLPCTPSVNPGMNQQTSEEFIHELQVHQFELETQADELRKLNIALLESRDQYLDLYEFAPLGYLTLTDKALISRVNLTGARLLGVNRNKLINARFRKWIILENLEAWDRYFLDVLNNESKLTTTLTLKREDGTTFPAQLESIRLTGSSNEQSIRVAISDISDIRKTENALRATEIRYRRLFETAQDGILILDAETGQIVEVNPYSTTMLGFSREEFLGKKIWDIGVFKDIVANKDNFEELQRKEYIRYEDLPLETADGRNIAVEFVSNVYMVNNKKVIQCNIRDITDRKKIEVALNATETRYRRLFETAQDGILILDAETGQIVEVNPFLIAFLGFSREQLLGKKIWEIGLFKDIVANKDNFEELQRKESIRYENLPLQTADGRNIAVEFVSNVYMVNDKKVIQCNIRDITDRKKIEVALNATETRYRRLFETAQDGILILDAETGQIVEVNPYSTTMLGFSREEFLGKKLWDIGVFKDIVANKDNFEELQRKEYIRYEDLPLETADGRNIAVEFVSNVYMVNDKKVIQCNIRDITDRKKIEVALNATETRYRRLFETAQDGILILDAETGQIVEVNPFLINILGFSREEFLGKKLWELGQFKDIVANKDNFEELQRKEYVRYEDMPIETADGRKIAVEFLSNLYTVNNKKVIQCNIRDITVRKNLEEDLVVKAAELARSNIELQQFAYVASHDLQEPLRAISGFTELLVKRYHGKIDERADKYLDFITEGTTRMQQMIQDLLAYSRVQTQIHEFVLIDSNTALDLAISDLQVATKEHHAVITHDPLPSIYVDQEQITKMFQNLIGNAIKFNKPGVAPKVHISAKQDENNWIFSVSDNGIGIDQQYADRVFKIFQRLHTRDEYPGTGIGLAICKRIAEQHGGTIWIESVPGSGSTFYFTIPKRKKEMNHERE
jgi:PAS domain S-box-containing protein